MEKIKMIIVSTTGFPRKEGISTIILDYLSRFDKERFCFDMIVPGEYDQTLVQEFKDKGKTILYSTHYMEEAENICDYVYLISEGKIIMNGTPKEIKEKTKTTNLRDSFFKIIGGNV